eukprot:Pgem_evm1s15924
MRGQVLDIIIHIIRFINSIVNSPGDLSLRVHLRNEFLDLKFERLLKILKEANTHIKDDELAMQIMIFNDEYESDQQELEETFLDADMSDPMSMAQAICRKTQHTDTFV